MRYIIALALTAGILLLLSGISGSEEDIFAVMQKGDVAKVKTMLDKNPKLVKARDGSGMMLLHWATFDGQKDMIDLLLKKGADVNAPGGVRSSTPLHMACVSGREEIVKILVENGADVKARNSAGMTPLHLAAEGGHVGIMEFLISKGADINAKDNNGLTPLKAAIEAGKNNSADFLRKEGAK